MSSTRGTIIDSRVSVRRDRVAVILDTHTNQDELSVETGMSIEDAFVLLGQLTNALHGAVSNREAMAVEDRKSLREALTVATTPSLLPTRCPDTPDDGDIVGCGHEFTYDPADFDGMVDCPACGICFNPEREA